MGRFFWDAWKRENFEDKVRTTEGLLAVYKEARERLPPGPINARAFVDTWELTDQHGSKIPCGSCNSNGLKTIFRLLPYLVARLRSQQATIDALKKTVERSGVEDISITFHPRSEKSEKKSCTNQT